MVTYVTVMMKLYYYNIINKSISGGIKDEKKNS